ncbi:MAG: hypothetical protein GC162_19570 [Planctomycetes bacterium]|nr:hypothetical protein [Planctomycetota bacterium]
MKRRRNNRLSPYERAILLGVVATIDLASDETVGWTHDRRVDVLAHGPLWRPADWLTRDVTATDRRRFMTAGAKLEAAGYVRLVRILGERVTHVEPTAQGIKLGIALALGEAIPLNVEALSRTLGASAWSKNWTLADLVGDSTVEDIRLGFIRATGGHHPDARA